MASIIIRNLEVPLKRKLRLRVARHGRSMEDEARHILRAALAAKASREANLFASIRRRVAPKFNEFRIEPTRGAPRPISDVARLPAPLYHARP